MTNNNQEDYRDIVHRLTVGICQALDVPLDMIGKPDRHTLVSGEDWQIKVLSLIEWHTRQQREIIKELKDSLVRL